MLSLDQQLLSQTFGQLRRCGGGRDECVAFWSGKLEQPGVVDQALHPTHSAGRGFYEVEQAWLNETWRALVREGRTLRAQVHTHGGRAFHSRSDDTFPIVGQPGFLSLVLPDHAVRDDLQGAYLARLGEDGCWQEVAIDEFLVIS